MEERIGKCVQLNSAPLIIAQIYNMTAIRCNRGSGAGVGGKQLVISHCERVIHYLAEAAACPGITQPTPRWLAIAHFWCVTT